MKYAVKVGNIYVIVTILRLQLSKPIYLLCNVEDSVVKYLLLFTGHYPIKWTRHVKIPNNPRAMPVSAYILALAAWLTSNLIGDAIAGGATATIRQAND